MATVSASQAGKDLRGPPAGGLVREDRRVPGRGAAAGLIRGAEAIVARSEHIEAAPGSHGYGDGGSGPLAAGHIRFRH